MAINSKLIEYLRQKTPARRNAEFEANSRRLHAPPPGGPTINAPTAGQPMTGPTQRLNAPNPNTVKIGTSTGGRTYSPNPFNRPPDPSPPVYPATPNRPVKGIPGNMGPIKPPGMGFGPPQGKPSMGMAPPPGAMPPPQRPGFASMLGQGTGMPGMGAPGAGMPPAQPPPQMAPPLQGPPRAAPPPPRMGNHMMPPQNQARQMAMVQALRGRPLR